MAWMRFWPAQPRPTSPPGAWRERPELPGLAAQGAAVAEAQGAVGAEEQDRRGEIGVGHAGMFRGGRPAVKENPGLPWPCGPGGREFLGAAPLYHV